MLSRGVSWLAAALVGAVYGVAATIAHSFTIGPVPVGMILGGIACAALLVALRALTGDRWAALAAGLGMMALLLVISQRGPGGSIVVPNTALGNIWMYVAAGIVMLIVAWPDTRRLSELSARAAATQGEGR
ncbi:histidinol dehydrogenase [Microbacterium sp. NPDC077391]|uniref:histidinol dehydrogenase n=1 Tax=unclassified Microbacterium TaxID=2609290 RepID=UPI0008FC46F1|nr:MULTISPECIES: histidinol dehydrogenase [unclassified Microbacterium]OIU84378.1 histidinol dehydrogenase [Microbacterium sp. AR7-10]